MFPARYLTPDGDGEEEPLADTLLQVQQECLRLERQNESLKAQLKTYRKPAAGESIAAKVFNVITLFSLTMLAIAFRRKLRHG